MSINRAAESSERQVLGEQARATAYRRQSAGNVQGGLIGVFCRARATRRHAPADAEPPGLSKPADSPAVAGASDSPWRFPANAPTTWNPASVKQWYDKTYFNLIVDYYTEAPGRPYGTGMTLENLTKSLKMCRPGYVTIMAKGHSGTTAFKSRLGTQHPMLGEDPLAVLRQATRQCGVKMILYYSGLIDGTAAERHPEWRPAGPDGKRDTRPIGSIPYRMAPICPSSRYLEDWAAVHLEEMITRYDPDGIWVDGDWGCRWCYCDDCKVLAVARFGDAQGPRHGGVPCLGEERVSPQVCGDCPPAEALVPLQPPLPAPAADFGFVNHLDYESKDDQSPPHFRLGQDFMDRRNATLGIPFEAEIVDTSFVKEFNTRSLPKTLDRLLQEGAGVLINGGKWTYWTYPMPNGAAIPSQMRLAKACRDWAAERRRSLARHPERPLDGRGQQFLPGTGISQRNPGVIRALVELHRSPDVIHLRQLKEPIPYRMLVLPGTAGIRREQMAMLERFVRGGGVLLSIGSTVQNPGMAQLLGVEVVRPDALTKEGHVLLADGSPACLLCNWSKVRPAGAEVWWKLYKSWDHDEQAGMPFNYPITARLDEEKPEEAGMPAVTARKVGRGLAVHLAGDPFPSFWTFGHPTVRAFTRELLKRMQPDPLFRTNAPSWVEVSLRTRGDELFVHFLNGNPGFDMSELEHKDLFVDEIPEVGPYEASVGCSHQPRAVFLEPGHQPLDTEWREGRLHFTVPRLKIHACVRIQGWGENGGGP